MVLQALLYLLTELWIGEFGHYLWGVLHTDGKVPVFDLIKLSSATVPLGCALGSARIENTHAKGLACFQALSR